MRHFYPLHGLLLFYNSYAKPLMLYGLFNYDSTSKTNLEPIDNAQKRIIRAIFFFKKSESLQNIIAEKIPNSLRNVYIRIS